MINVGYQNYQCYCSRKLNNSNNIRNRLYNLYTSNINEINHKNASTNNLCKMTVNMNYRVIFTYIFPTLLLSSSQNGRKRHEKEMNLNDYIVYSLGHWSEFFSLNNMWLIKSMVLVACNRSMEEGMQEQNCSDSRWINIWCNI